MSRTKRTKPTFEQWSQQDDVKKRFQVVPAFIVAEMIKTQNVDLNKARAQAMREEYAKEYSDEDE